TDRQVIFGPLRRAWRLAHHLHGREHAEELALVDPALHRGRAARHSAVHRPGVPARKVPRLQRPHHRADHSAPLPACFTASGCSASWNRNGRPPALARLRSKCSRKEGSCCLIRNISRVSEYLRTSTFLPATPLGSSTPS